MKKIFKNIWKKLPGINHNLLEIERLNNEIEQLKKNQLELNLWVPPGHYYSPIPSIEEIKLKEQEIFDELNRELPGIDLNEAEQLALFDKFQQYYQQLPFAENKQEGLRYFFENPAYSYSDAICLYCMIRYAQPKKIIEVGSGYSSCVTLDVNELYFQNEISCTFIEPYPELLLSLIKDSDIDKIEIIASQLQDVRLEKFSELSAGDILFIDSTHVSKVNSDVNYILFKILPYINSGVYIHFHDIFYPFEYPKTWIYENRAWNEDYILRAFLSYNNAFKIIFFNTFLENFYQDRFQNNMPLCMKNLGGSIWLQKN
ncbi:class I SAM-dependent methyltransferase [Calothrix sp. FACHB-1219]|uniref:class I SAM-dependent methyltransferase n=1 Tax=unclassified Calothrix TaxID=2619626 RepID=UPI00168498B5|nr:MULTISPECIES: class I SAM-dependent methyltransferase [unclassified Calothrix]MBD2206525.1 class I SAM-dependent methyltransferase [Calothrix sp. FACHB-168]MBD2221321.1 class I SAM-dependent methyltransferase [Calothrix sp. FACHB-1219]